jgi:hypothetical protein
MRAILLSVVLMVFFSNVVPSAADKRKLHPELFDPVLGDRAAVIEWAWSPQYAKRFGLPVQKDGLKDGPLWLLGIKIQRQQFRDFQSYRCSILGLIENRTPILTPPGDMFLDHPSNQWIGGFPGKPKEADMAYCVKGEALREYVPVQSAWWKPGKKRPEPTKPASGITINYLYYYRSYLPDLAFFELNGGCAYFKDPNTFRNEISFPVPEKGRKPYAFSPKAMKFVIPDDLMRRVYSYTVGADLWTQRLMRRARGK